MDNYLLCLYEGIKGVYYTQGSYDMVVIVEGDERRRNDYKPDGWFAR